MLGARKWQLEHSDLKYFQLVYRKVFGKGYYPYKNTYIISYLWRG